MRRGGFITGLYLIALTVSVAAVWAQSSGQVYVQAFEDRNGNGIRDAGEPLLTGGVAVNLMNADGVIVASALLDDSPNAARGLVGFQQMRAGDYTIDVTSAEFAATTEDTFTVTVSDSGVPPVLEFGAQRALDEAALAEIAGGATDALTRDAQILQVALSGGGAALTMCGMVVLGLIIYFATLHRALNRARHAEARLTTATVRPVPTDTGEYPASSTARFRPPPEQPKRSTDEYQPKRATDEYQPFDDDEY
jgi:hypothetical protein